MSKSLLRPIFLFLSFWIFGVSPVALAQASPKEVPIREIFPFYISLGDRINISVKKEDVLSILDIAKNCSEISKSGAIWIGSVRINRNPVQCSNYDSDSLLISADTIGYDSTGTDQPRKVSLGRQRLTFGRINSNHAPDQQKYLVPLPRGSMAPFKDDNYRNIEIIPNRSGVSLGILNKTEASRFIKGNNIKLDRLAELYEKSLPKIVFKPNQDGKNIVNSEIININSEISISPHYPMIPVINNVYENSFISGDSESNFKVHELEYNKSYWKTAQVSELGYGYPIYPDEEKAIPLISSMKSENICGSSYTYDIGGQFNKGVLMSLLSYASNIAIIGPATLGTPTESSSSTDSNPLELRERTVSNFISTGLKNGDLKRAQNLIDYSGKNSIVYLIDTLGSGEYRNQDSFSYKNVYTKNGEYITRGHGAIVEKLIKWGVAQDTTIKPVLACDKTGFCQLDNIVRGLCAAANTAKSSDERVIVNLSLATPNANPILENAIKAALEAGAVIVTGFGNNDGCANQGLDGRDFCNAYPADWTRNTNTLYKNLFSVGAWDTFANNIHGFQRGQAVNGEPQKATLTKPSIYAPGYYWFTDDMPIDYTKLNIASNIVQTNLRPYIGTSFSAPILTGIFASWGEKCPNAAWPDIIRLTSSSKNLDANKILSQSCP